MRQKATDAITQAGDAKLSAIQAAEAAASAIASTDNVKREADAFKASIDSALKLASEAESRLKDALTHADAAADLAKGYEAETVERRLHPDALSAVSEKLCADESS